MARIIGYDRGLTGGDVPALTALGCEESFIDARPGTSVMLPSLEAAVERLSPGDVLAVLRLGAMGHDLRDLAPRLLALHRRGLHLVSRDDGVDTRADGGRFFEFVQMLARLQDEAAAERRKRAEPGATTRAADISDDDWDEIEPQLAAGEISVAQAAEILDVSRAAVLRRMKA
ncbi:recombinase family protein [Caulobacter sp. 17J65-9]|uniref:recombinase family protein n=1 Tax=Caulobacter sp. 17J65-9 TaxID=2709382 RepID=UPI0013CA7E57|nr:recombinase family protein [Caulobacter sp. 17J65-9]NEX94173.1 recombinase family protein [Caulobacter sp. 17J65-9]